MMKAASLVNLHYKSSDCLLHLGHDHYLYKNAMKDFKWITFGHCICYVKDKVRRDSTWI